VGPATRPSFRHEPLRTSERGPARERRNEDRFYYEDAHGTRHLEPTTVPLGVAGFAGDFPGVRRFAERDHKNLVQWNMHPEPGGHYAAHLEPDVLADDIRDFYRRYQ
jgi:hypothetical protein